MHVNDRILNIDTSGVDVSQITKYYKRYEGTPYQVLDAIAQIGLINSNSKVVDFGSGKGRAAFIFNYYTGCEVIGIEFFEKLHNNALDNLKSFCGNDKEKISFINDYAENYSVTDEDIFYFFQPFSLEIFDKVLNNILKGENAKYIIFYYLNRDYLKYLSNHPNLKMLVTIDCRNEFDTYGGNQFSIFEIKKDH